MMRGVGMLLIVAACGAAAPPESLPTPRLVKGEVPPPPMPAYGGARRTGRCAIYLAHADDREVQRREAAIRARLPASATLELTGYGDRAARVSIPIARTPMKKPKPAIAIARAFVRDTAEIWGVAGVQLVGHPARVGRDRWAVELEVSPFTAVQRGFRADLIVVRVDGRRGLLEAGFVVEPAPSAEVCDGPLPALDRDRLRAAARGRYADEDVGTPEWWLFTNEPVVRWVAAVPVGRGIGGTPRGVDPATREARIEQIVFVDPDTFEVVGHAPPPFNMPYDPAYEPASDARVVFDR
ncbi:MAG TPA: hypothetical protein VL463_13285 [Kofleriaceae bacterium]|nr:hypothetical protein [Kofleriaceae bacterium]